MFGMFVFKHNTSCCLRNCLTIVARILDVRALLLAVSFFFCTEQSLHHDIKQKKGKC